ncbi:hypothetical protein CEXT_732471 [Caerostris extrusa]|uniref:Uncharacterized protein n=1 Tax=Caerostris extrusa TaxID=172846 RepID=A0AAV4R0Q1_CAEEX|nr:hypothetical protein CEXT_732471 [Caerostris extrusa]
MSGGGCFLCFPPRKTMMMPSLKLPAGNDGTSSPTGGPFAVADKNAFHSRSRQTERQACQERYLLFCPLPRSSITKDFQK